MAEVLLNPTNNYIQNNLVDSNNINPNINNDGNSYGYNNSSRKNAAFYTEQQTRLKNMLQGNLQGFTALNGNYTVKSFNIQSTTNVALLNELQGAFYEIIQDSSESVQNEIIGESRRLDLTDIAVNRKFEIKITGENFNDTLININKTYDTFTQALSDSTVNNYIKNEEGYYLDLSSLKSGSVVVTYVKNN